MKLRLTLPTRASGLRLGFPGLIATGATVLCAGLYFSAVQPAQERRDAARLTASSLQQRIAQGGRETGQPPSLGEQLAAFYRLFPAEQNATDLVGTIVAIARRHDLVLQQADYKAERDKTGRLTRFEMNLPLRGEYRAIRRFLSDVSAEMPVVSLEQVQFERQKVGDAQVDAKLRLVMYLGRAS